ncbi:hypothetical protein [Streptomyces fuscigenes]|uniref:hypothetical protein n=1 Tax=Streptomyces fuscigenes TaxID=1528880 RepID=UPI001F1C631A|nr:hypothetical protein [Streptomyces fuscigenes]MCF3961840.1 hypothetical protein [Streptomyces fuscigenes]
MQSLKRTGTSASAQFDLDVPAHEDGEFDDTFEMYRVICPACTQPIALLADEDTLPEHALCPTRWNPFVLSVCSGTGTAAADARPADTAGAHEQDAGLLLTLPQGLDWRTQPFSHVGGPGSRPVAARHRTAA